MQQYIGFTLDETEFTVPIVRIKEIINMPAVTRIPQAPHYIEGVTNLRGAVIPLVNLRSLTSGNGSLRGAAKVIVVAGSGMTFGIIVDRITGVVKIEENDIQPPERVLKGTVDQVEGIARVQDRLVVVLDTSRLLPSNHPELCEGAVGTGESPTGDTVEVAGNIQSIGAKSQNMEVRDAREFLERRGICPKDPRYLLFDDVLQFMEALGDGDSDRAERAIGNIAQKGQGDLFREVGKVARKLHDSVRGFNEVVDPTIRGLVTDDMPRAIDSLQLVIKRTEEAANKTMSIVEGHILNMDEMAANLRRLSGPEDAVAYLREFKNRIEDDFTEIITTQSFQDITGQAISKVIELVGEVESELVRLVTTFGVKVEQPTACEVLAGERVSQSDVDDLLRDFGF